MSTLRHAVFTLQFYLVLIAFGVETSFELIFWIWQVYFWVTLSPSLLLGKIGIRESIAVIILSQLLINESTMFLKI